MSKIIVGLGELLWDVFSDGRRPGGAPANVAFHAQQLGNHGIVASRVGADEDGQRISTWLQEKGLNIAFLQRDEAHATGTVFVHIADGEPEYRITENVAWDFLAFTPAWSQLAKTANAVCFATLAQRNPTASETIHRFLAEVPNDCLKVMDINMRKPFFNKAVLQASLPFADVLKLNADEKKAIGLIFGVSDPHQWLLEHFEISWICQTHGKGGAELITKDASWFVKGESVDVSKGDAVGVGDAFLAALTTAILRKDAPEQALQFANRYAAKVATFKGAMPVFSLD